MKSSKATFGSIAILSLILVVYIPSRLSFVFLYVTLLLPAISFLMCASAYYFTEFSQTISQKEIIKNDKIEIFISVRSRFPFAVSYMNPRFYTQGTGGVNENVLIPMPNFKGTKIKYEVVYNTRGEFSAGVSALFVTDILGLFTLKKKISPALKVTVFPKIFKINSFLVNKSSGFEASPYKSVGFEDLSEITDIRKYERTDTFKRIHWKLSSKRNELMVKKYEATSKIFSTIILNLNEPEGKEKTEDKIIETAISLTNYFLENDIHAKLIYSGPHIVEQEIARQEDFQRVYQILAKIRFSNDTEFYRLCEIAAKQLDLKGSAVFITSRLDREIAGNAALIKAQGQKAIVVFVYSSKNGGIQKEAKELFNDLNRLGITVLATDSEETRQLDFKLC